MKNQLQLIALVSILMVIGGCSPQLKALNVVPKPEIETVELESLEVVSEIISSNYQPLAESLDAYLLDQSFNGVTLVASGDQIILLKAYGLAQVNEQEEMTVDHQFQIASVSKSFVAVSILQLVEAGKLTLDQTIDKYFPDMPNAELITIHQLLTHTSGLYSGDDLTNYSQVTTVDEIIAPAFKSSNLYYEEPGTYSIYSNLGYDVLGAIIEQVSGQTYADYIEEHVLIPAGMTQSGLNMEGLVLENMATAYNGNISEGDEAKVLHPSFGYSSGGLHSTAMDLYKYDRALHSNLLISQESYDLMTQESSKVGTKSYGYGWYVNTGVEDTVSHPGNLIGWHSMLLRHQEDKVTVILLTNHDENDMFMAYNLARLVLAEVE
ncbi:MAG: serine hydrolase domain-containing protein [Turicibacter sp.]|uniref:serine hydrolase domain-containing protein n=1 Tax=Turicibacter TaxID=191303 RepID=UPI0006BF16D5|nr:MULTISPECIES: serine hydrolase domain-containing protein [Turicibacter]MDD6759813.1 serine hydrolase [Turicibacter sp.]CUN65178.1 Penicillin-binding protein E [Turicibacter sanguinis]MBS3201917.1 beta-lactamase family protein [Turicibacter bilis]MCU7208097.1 beta-lactamase family protein [Turicibacter sp. GALT-G1]MDY4814796.1 serine hydrolase domain-containing protein [Turicibacter bilis]